MFSKVKIQGSGLQLGDVHVTFQRTLRIPDDGGRYPLPPGLGTFPLRKVDDYRHRVPSSWVDKGGVFLPMYQREALWLRFTGKKRALKVGIGKVCAITGERWREGLIDSPQNYLVTGQQPWLDGVATGAGTIRQFVAMPLGSGYSVEKQITGDEVHGGIQLQVYEPKDTWRAVVDPRHRPMPGLAAPACAAPGPYRRRAMDLGAEVAMGKAMGLAAGGQMKQKIAKDRFGLEAWNQRERKRIFVHIVNSEHWQEITGEALPPSPVSARSYVNAGLPFYDLYEEHVVGVGGGTPLSNVRSVRELDHEVHGHSLQDDDSLQPSVQTLWQKVTHLFGVRDGDW